MSGSTSRRRKRKIRRESIKEEIRCCREMFADVITGDDGDDWFPHRDYNTLTGNYRNGRQSSQAS